MTSETGARASRSPGWIIFAVLLAMALALTGVALSVAVANETPNAETWLFDPATNKWTQKSPANAPSARGWHAMVYSPSAGRVVLFGGGPDRYHPTDDTWVYDSANNTWTQPGAMPPVEAPGARNYHGMVYDEQFNRIILFGGIIVDTTSPDIYRPVADTWARNSSSGEWTRLAPSAHPYMSSTDIGQDTRMIGFGALAYDAESDAIVFFKSLVDNYDDPTPFVNAPANETWVLQGAKQQWVPMGPGDREAPSAGRFGPSMAYDVQSDRIILFGGWNYSTDRSYPRDTWAYDFNTNTWQRMSPAVNPPGRNYHRMVYDPKTDRVILFGGFPSSGAFNDMWAYDYDADTWTPLNPVVAPSPRGYHAMAYDEKSRTIVLFGGVSGETTFLAVVLGFLAAAIAGAAVVTLLLLRRRKRNA